MRRSDEQGNQSACSTFSTLDAYLAGFLSINGCKPTLKTERSGKIAFHFEASDTLYQRISEYNAGATCVALQLALTVKNLKSQIFSRRSDDEKNDG
ncbi:MAG: DUF5659 domain-containing protein [Syntrophorhabdales bacterium]|jgi:hypothetical protein